MNLDDRLLKQAMRIGNFGTKRAAIEAGLRLLIQTHAQTGIRRLRGKVGKVSFKDLPSLKVRN